MCNYILRAKNFRAKKKLGQNFLISKEIIEKIANYAQSEDSILEIGAGLGFVTEKLVDRAKRVVAVEIDNDAILILEKKLSQKSNFLLIKNDILKTDIASLFDNDKKIKVIANIPYYITTPILLSLLGEIDDINHPVRKKTDEIILMVQLEVAKRICADNNAKNKEYGLLSILSNFWAETSIEEIVTKKMFYPSPKVDSAIVKFKINDTPKVPPSPNLKAVIKGAFAMRRKNIKNCLLASGFINVKDALEKSSISPDLRGENLSIEDFYRLSLNLEKRGRNET